jgi:hypothetical protein
VVVEGGGLVSGCPGGMYEICVRRGQNRVILGNSIHLYRCRLLGRGAILRQEKMTWQWWAIEENMGSGVITC